MYHDLIPVVCGYLGGDRCRVRSALLLGGTAPLVMFLLWDAVALALAPAPGLLAGAADPLQTLMLTGGPIVGSAVGVFSLLAIITSFIGTVLGGFKLLLRGSFRILI